MRKYLAALGLTFLLIATAQAADGKDVAYNVLKSKGILAKSDKLCSPKYNNMKQQVTLAESALIDKDHYAVIVYTELCNGGNMLGEYLVLTNGNSGKLIEDADIGDYNFLVENILVKNNKIILRGNKWRTSDSHCCPTLEGTLEYNLKTKKQKFIPDNK